MVALMSVTEDQAVGKLMASGLRERERRTILRDLERGDVTPAEIVAALNGKIDTSRGDDDDDDDEDEDGDKDEDGEEADGDEEEDELDADEEDEENEEDEEVEAPKGRAAASATAAAKGSA